MEIQLQLNKDFERCLNDMRVKYGEDFEIINGVHPSQLDYSEFLMNFTKNDTLADTSIDPNANANTYIQPNPKINQNAQNQNKKMKKKIN